VEQDGGEGDRRFSAPPPLPTAASGQIVKDDVYGFSSTSDICMYCNCSMFIAELRQSFNHYSLTHLLTVRKGQ